VNRIDYFTVSNIPGIEPLPHIPEAEVTGIIEKVGNHVTALKEGDKVVLYNSVLMGHVIYALMVMKCYVGTAE
jgi:NADPH:quinone reductase-like Zn-dependent oxidoreductase